MLRKYFPEMMDNEEREVVASLLQSLQYLKKEALREGQAFIAYAIEDAIIQTQEEDATKYTPPHHHNIR